MNDDDPRAVLDEIICRWPDFVTSKGVVGKVGSISIDDAYSFSERISASYIGGTHEIIYRNACDSVYSSIRKASELCVVVRPSELRFDVIISDLNKRLCGIVSIITLGWRNEDIECAEKFLERIRNESSQ